MEQWHLLYPKRGSLTSLCEPNPAVALAVWAETIT
jgi:hypothetical protein